MRKIAALLIALAVPLIVQAQCQQQAAYYPAQPSLDVSVLCQQALQTVQVAAPVATYNVQATYAAPALAMPVYSVQSFAVPSYSVASYSPAFAVRSYSYSPQQAFVSRSFVGGYGASQQVIVNNGFQRSNQVIVNNGFARQSSAVVVNNNFQRQGGGGGFVQGLGNAVSQVIGAVGQVANSPAGLVAIGAGIGGAGPLGFLGGGNRGGGGAQSFFNFQAAQNAGRNPSAAAAFAASQRGRGR